MSAPPPVAMLAELTHRCPLACPYCSNPMELTRKERELDTRGVARRLRAGRGPRGAARPSLRRRAAVAARPGAAGRRRAGGGSLREPHHLGDRADRAPAGGARRGRARPRAAVAAGDRRSHGRPDRRLSRRLRAQDAGGGVDRGGGAAADAELRHAPAEHAPARRGDRDGRGAGRAAARGRDRAVPRLGDGEPRGADADAGAGEGGGRDGAGGARAAAGAARHRLRAGRLSCALPEALHGRLGDRPGST